MNTVIQGSENMKQTRKKCVLFRKSIKQTFKRVINKNIKAEDSSALLDVFSLQAA